MREADIRHRSADLEAHLQAEAGIRPPHSVKLGYDPPWFSQMFYRKEFLF
jgi:hypothetical protein